MRSRQTNSIVKRVVLLTIMLILSMIIVVPLLRIESYAANRNNYYIKYSNYKDEVSIEVGKKEVIISQYSQFDLTNLELYEKNKTTTFTFEGDSISPEVINKELRESLLYWGYAKLIDTSVATFKEKENQNNAQKNLRGIWAQSNDTSQEETKPSNADSDITDSGNTETSTEIESNNIEENKSDASSEYNTNLLFECLGVITSFFAGLGVLGYIGGQIYLTIAARTEIFFGGENASGKTTISLYFLNPDASYDDLINQEPTLKENRVRIIRDDKNRRRTLVAHLIDTPGNEYGCAIDNLYPKLIHRIFRKKYYIVLVLSPTKSNCERNNVDIDYVKDQLSTIIKLWKGIITAKRTVKPMAFILFINKLDLFDDRNNAASCFKIHKEFIEKYCNAAKLPFECIYGSAVDRSGFAKLINILKG